MTDTHAALTAYLRGNFWPSLPHAYVDWVVSILDDMQEAVHAADYGDLRPIDTMIPVHPAVIATGVMPRAARDDGGSPEIRLGDLISALRLYDHFTAPTDDDDDDTESE